MGADEAAVEAVGSEIAQLRNRFPNYPPIVTPMDGDAARAVLATPIVAGWRRDAERLRDLAAMFEGHPNRDQQTYRGVQIAAMLRGDGA